MTDLEISKSLALAIGWREEHVIEWYGCVYVDLAQSSPRSAGWRVFDYRDWNVIGPIAEKYDCFPFLFQERDQPLMWHTFDTSTGNQSQADTPQKAIALAVINGAKT